MIQKMPETDGHDEDGWERIVHLTTTVQETELTQLDAPTLLNRLFNEETLTLFDAEEVVYECPEDRSRVTDMLLSLGEEEVRSILKEQGEIVIHNEMCNFHIRFNEADIDELFNKSAPSSVQ